MKRLSIFLSALFIISLMFVACNEDEKTELGWINDSGAAINEIVWADGDAEWEKTDGYADTEQTESKSVDETTGAVECTIDTGGGNFDVATVDIDGQGPTLNIPEGESNVYTINAQPAKKSEE